MKTPEWKKYFLVFLEITFFGIVTGMVGCNQTAAPAQPNLNQQVSAQPSLDGKVIPKDEIMPCPTNIIDSCGCAGNTPLECSPTPGVSPTTVPTATPICPILVPSGSLISYKQTNPLWANYVMPITDEADPCDADAGLGNTIGCVGCLFTCLAMIQNENPYQLDVFLSPFGVFDDNGRTTMDYALDYMKKFNNEIVNLPNAESIDDIMPGNSWLIMKMGYATSEGFVNHFVMITGATRNPTTGACDFSIDDPGFTGRPYLSFYISKGWQLLGVYGIIPTP